MKRDRFQCLEALFDEAVGLEGAQLRELLERVGVEDAELRGDLERLLEQDREGDCGLDETAFHLVKEELAGAIQERSAPFPMERIGHYRILEKIGEGGMGTVFLAEQDSPHRRVALKVVRLAPLSPDLRRRFHLETEVLGCLQHPGIAQILEAGEIDTDWGRVPYFAMEYVDGLDLRRYVERHALGVRARLELVARICDAAHHAHQKGIVHRDLKPENVLVVDDSPASGLDRGGEFADLGQPKVLDFGIARVTDSDVRMTTVETGEAKLVGTLSYMSPEQLAGDSTLLDTRSDVYALGVLLYEVLSGQAPFVLSHRSIPEAARLIRDEEPTRLGQIRTAFRGDIETIVGRAMEKDRERRYSSAAELALDLRRYLASEPIIARSPSTFYRLGKFALRHTGLVSGIAMSFLFLLVGLVLTLRFAHLATQEKGRAQRSEAVALLAAYRNSLTAAEAVGGSAPQRAMEHLEAAPSGFRDWEWNHFRARISSHLSDHDGGGSGDGFSTACGSDGTLLAARIRAGRVELLTLDSAEVLGVFGDGGGLTRPVLSPDGSHLVALSELDEKLIGWDTRSRERLFEVPATSLRLRHVCFSPDGGFVVLSWSDAGGELLDTRSGQSLFRTTPYPTSAQHAAFASDGTRFALCGTNWGESAWRGFQVLCIYTTAGELAARCDISRLGQGCTTMAFSPDGSRLALGEEQRAISIRETAALEEVNSLIGHLGMLHAVSFAPDGVHLASAAADGTARLWDVASARTIRVLMLPEGRDPTRSLSFSPDGARIAAGGGSWARLWSLDHGAIRVLRGHETYVYLVAFSPDGSMLASAGWDDTVRLWDPLTGDLLAVLPAKWGIHELSFTPEGDRLVGLAIWDPATGEAIRAPSGYRGDADRESDYFQLAAGGAKAVDQAGETHASSRDRSLRADVLDSGEVCISDQSEGEVIARIGPHDCAVFAVAFSPDAEHLASGDADGTVRIWRLADGREVATLTAHAGRVFSIQWSPGATRIASAGDDGTIVLWDAHRYERVAVLRGHESYVHSVSFSPDGTMLASASGDGTVRIWDSRPSAVRWRQLRSEEAWRREAAPLVAHLFDELESSPAVAAHLRADHTLSESLRRAALRVLLERSVAAGPGEVGR